MRLRPSSGGWTFLQCFNCYEHIPESRYAGKDVVECWTAHCHSTSTGNWLLVECHPRPREHGASQEAGQAGHTSVAVMLDCDDASLAFRVKGSGGGRGPEPDRRLQAEVTGDGSKGRLICEARWVEQAAPSCEGDRGVADVQGEDYDRHE